MNEKDLGEFEFVRETTVSLAERPKSEDVFAVCLESDDEKLLVDKARVIDEATNLIEKHRLKRLGEKALA